MKIHHAILLKALAMTLAIGLTQSTTADLQNAAYLSSATASSNLGGWPPANAVNEVVGNEGWHALTTGASQWWLTDLGAVVPIDYIDLRPRTGYNTRLDTASVRVFESADGTGTPVYTADIEWQSGSSFIFKMPAGTYGRSVMVTNTATGMLNLGEAYVYSENLARGKPTSMSAFILNGPSTGVDGTRTAGQPNIVHSSGASPWWQVDLERVCNIDSVRLFNRAECCQERLADLNMQIMADDGSTVLYDYQAENAALINPANILSDPTVITLNLHGEQVQGRYIRISRTATPLQMSEVEVYGTALVENRPATDIASTSATANGFVGGSDLSTFTHVYWGAIDQGTNWTSWANTNLVLGAITGDVSVALSGLTLNESYYYRFSSTNVAGTGYASASEHFRTIPVSDGMVLWMDASALDLADGASVSSWGDSAPNAWYDLTQGTGAAQPTFYTNGFGGQSVVSFDGGDSVGSDLMQTDWPSSDVTIFFVSSADVLAQNNSFYRAHPDDGADRFLSHSPHNASGQIYFDMGNSGAGRLQWGHTDVVKTNVWCYRAESGVGQNAWRNGMSVASDGTTANFSVSGYKFLLGESFIGDVGEIIIYNRALSVAERNAVGFYLSEKYSLGGMYHDPDSGPGSVADMALWLDADAIQDVSHAGDVVTWFDRSGGDRNASQASANSGTLNTNVLGGKPVVRFDGADGNYFTFPQLTTIRSVFWVLKEDAGATFPRFLLGDSTGTSIYHFHRDAGATKYLWGASAHANVRNGETSVDGTVVNGLTTAAPTTHGIVSLLTTGNVTANSLSRDRNNITPQRTWDGDVAELIIYTRELSDSEMNTVGYYLADKYGLSANYATVDNADGATDVASTTATLNGNLIDAEGLSTTVSVFWGTTDGGTNAADWGTTNSFAAVTEATSFSTDLTALSTSTAYYYRFYATNASGDAWATASEVFVTPMSITNGLALWLNASTLSVDGDGTSVALWEDISGNGHHMAQSDTARQPVVRTTGLNGHPAVEFDGSNDRMFKNAVNISGREIFAVVVSDSNSGFDTVLSRAADALSMRANDGFYIEGNGNDFPPSGGLRQNNVVTLTKTVGQNVILHANAGSVKSFPNFMVGDQNQHNRYWHGDIAEIIVFDRELTSAERNEVGVYLSEKYGINSGYTTETIPTVPTGLQLWLSASEIHGGSHGDSVSTWYDLSGNGQDARQITGGFQPTLATNAVGGQAAVRFDGSNDHLDGPAVNITAKTIYMVLKMDPTAVSLSGVFAQKGVDFWNVRSQDGFWNSPHINDINAADFSYLGEISVNGEDWSGHSSLYHIVKVVDADTSSLQYRLSQTSSSRYFKGDLSEVIVYNRELTSQEDSLIGYYLEDKYGLDTAHGQIDNADGATDVTTSSAALNGNLSGTDDGLSTTVSVYWGTSDGGAVATAWENTNTFTAVTALTNFSVNVSSLASAQVHFYRYYATNSAGDVWADSSAMFETKFSSVTNGLVLWLDATAMGSLGDGAAARSWTDLSGNSRHIYQTESVRQPIYRATGLNSVPSLEFDGGDDRMFRALENLSAREIFAVAVTDVATGWENLLSNASDGHNIRAFNGIYQDGGANFPAAGQLRQNNKVSLTQTAGENVILHAPAGSLKTFGTFMVGDNGIHSRYWDGDIAEVIVYDRTLSTAERQLVGAYLAQKYGINAGYTDETVPRDVSGLKLWVAGDAINGVIDGGGVATWYDLSDDGRHMNRNSAAQSPIFKTGIVNGLPAVRFSGHDDNYFTFSRISDIRTIFWVMLEDVGAARSSFLLGDTLNHYMHRGGGGVNQNIWNGTHGYRWTRGLTKIDGSPIDGTGTPMPTTMSLITAESISDSVANAFSNDRGISGRTWDGDLAELIIYNRLLTEAEESLVGYYLEKKYGLTTDYHQIDNAGGASDLTLTAATLNGSLNGTDDETSTELRVYWGDSDGGSTAGAWQFTNILPAVTVAGPFSSGVSGLQQDSQYYYRSYASNAVAGSVWATATAAFKTPFNTVTNGLVYWVDAGAIPEVSDGQAVEAWDDLSPSDYTTRQPTASARPTYVASGTGGKPAVSFDGGDTLRTTGLISTWPAGDGTIYVVSKADNLTQASSIYRTDPFDATRMSSHLPWSDGSSYFDYGNSGSGRLVWSNVNAIKANVWCFRSELGVGQQVYRNRTLVASDGTTASFAYSGYAFMLGDGYEGDISEILVYNRALSDGEREQIFSHLSEKYGVDRNTLFMFK